jgi:glycerol-3-phosphate acyltransferase PlsY
VEDGGYEWFSVGCICGVFVCCVPNFYVILFQYLLYSIYWNCIVSDGSIVAQPILSCFMSMNRQAGMMKLIVAFCNFVKTPKDQ